MRNRAAKPINRHFENHSAADVRISVLAKMYNGSKISRRLHEEKWIKLLNTKFPNVCKVKVNLYRKSNPNKNGVYILVEVSI